ncbi:MAG: AAA family ATPase [Gemmatimonadota bacterium]
MVARTSGVANLWEPYGLRGSPFFQDELRPGAAEHPMGLFVGREVEVRRVHRRIISDAGSRSIVEGEPGVGKTSFINRVKAEVAESGVATYEHPIRIQSGSTAATLIGDVLRLLLRIRLASARTSDAGGFWSRTARLLEGGELMGATIGAFGVSGGVSRGYAAPQVAQDSLYEHLGEALERIRGESGRGVVIHVNNLENLTEEDAEEASALLRDLRDHLMLPGAHWIFGGAAGVDTVFRRHAQVDGIFPAPESLAPLAPEHIEALLRLRYDHLSIPRRRRVSPIEPAVAARLYSLYQGDLRSFLRLLADAAERGLGLAGVRPMEADEVLRHTRDDYGRHLRQRTGEGDFEHLRGLTLATGSAHEFRVTDAARILEMKQSSASQLMDRLQRARVIRRVRTEGKSVFYRPVGSVLVAFGGAGDLFGAAE